jgi:hypothetical protein
MTSIWERFDGIVSKDEVAEAKTQFSPIEAGDYKVILEELAPAENKQGLPMLKGKFRIVSNNRILFYNQNLQNLNYPQMTAVNVAEAVDFIGGLLDEEIEFVGFSELEETIKSVPIGGAYKVNVSYGKKDYEMKFPKIKILEKTDIDAPDDTDPYIDVPDDLEDLPFN